MTIRSGTLALPLVLIVATTACGGSSVDTSTRADADAAIPDATRDASTPPSWVADSSVIDPVDEPDSGLREGGLPDAQSSVCSETYDSATVRLALPDGRTPSVDSDEGLPYPNRSLDVRGIVSNVTANSFEIETSAFGDTTDEILRFEITTPHLVLGLTPGIAVRVRYKWSSFWAIQQAIEVTGLEIQDTPEGATSTPGLLLAVVDGSGPFDDSPYNVDVVALGCYPEAGEGCGALPPDNYAFVFSPKDEPTNVVSVAMGHQETLVLNGQALRVRNLRSFESGYCDDYWNFAYFISR